MALERLAQAVLALTPLASPSLDHAHTAERGEGRGEWPRLVPRIGVVMDRVADARVRPRDVACDHLGARPAVLGVEVWGCGQRPPGNRWPPSGRGLVLYSALSVVLHSAAALLDGGAGLSPHSFVPSGLIQRLIHTARRADPADHRGGLWQAPPENRSISVQFLTFPEYTQLGILRGRGPAARGRGSRATGSQAGRRRRPGIAGSPLFAVTEREAPGMPTTTIKIAGASVNPGQTMKRDPNVNRGNSHTATRFAARQGRVASPSDAHHRPSRRGGHLAAESDQQSS